MRPPVLFLVAVLAGLVPKAFTVARAEEPPRAAQSVPAVAVPEPGPQATTIARAACKLLEREHYLGRPIDDEVARRWLKKFLEALDPMKAYFLQSDIDQFMTERDTLDDSVKKGDVSFAHEVLAVFLQRVDLRLPLIERLVQTPQDFTTGESLMIDRDATTWPRNEAEAEDLWRRRIKYDFLVQKMEKTPEAEAKEKLLRRYRGFAKRMHQMTADQLLETYLTTLASSLDPHSSFMSPGTLENLEIQMKLQPDGIGASLKVEDGHTTVVGLVPGGAADRDGRLKVGDRIVAVGERAEGDLEQVVDLNPNEVVERIRGKRGTVVRLKVIPAGEPASKIYDIVRDQIKLEDGEARGEIIAHGKKLDGSSYRIGVISLPIFSMDSGRDCGLLLDDFRQQGVDAVVLDLRSNQSGFSSEAISIVGLFIDRGPVVQVKNKNKAVNVYHDTDPGVAWSGPLVVLTNKFSAGGSELVAGAIQDYGRGLIVGDSVTNGKGTVQSLFDLGRQVSPRSAKPLSLGSIKLTTQQSYRPSGDSNQLLGVKTDVALPSISTYLPVGEKELDAPLDFDRLPAAKFQPTGPVNRRIVARLREQSQSRVAASEAFERLAGEIERSKSRTQAKTLSLVEADFARQWNESKVAEDQRLGETESRKRSAGDRDFSFDEVMNVTVDYVQALASGGGGGNPQQSEVAEPTNPAPGATPPSGAAAQGGRAQVGFAPRGSVEASAETSQVQTATKATTRLYVKTLPPGAQVTLDGKPLGASDGLFLVPAGTGKVSVQFDGGEPEVRQVEIADGRITRVEFTRTPVAPAAAAAAAGGGPDGDRRRPK